MLFNSLDFAIFLPVVFLLYWFVIHRNLKLQNLFITAASYFFYGWWDWRFLTLIVFSTVADYSVGIMLGKKKSGRTRRLLLYTSLLVNLGFLGFFKYYNFFIDNFVSAFTFFGSDIKPNSLNVILPVGISFYTFQTLSYTIDVYRRKIKPATDLTAFSAFVAFFPQLVAGPIERAVNLLPQFYNRRTFIYGQAVSGMRQILWGLFKKIVIADNSARFANMIFDNSSDLSGSTLLLGAMFFAFQIYGDFSGYSDIAIGTARLFGFNLMRNFAFPYFSRDIAEFWRRWHISLSSWFRDYLYIPLGGSRGGSWVKVRNIFIIFIVSGFWHGANWTFIAWGALNALFFLPLLLTNNNRNNLGTVAEGRLLPTMREAFLMLTTFSLTLLAWIFFRAENIGHALSYVSGIFSLSLFSVPRFGGGSGVAVTIVLIVFFMVIEWLYRDQQFALANLAIKRRPVKWAVYSILIFLTGMYMQSEETPFIYFQF
jgi:alginate O-acetyltransferase complex protein AlgI